MLSHFGACPRFPSSSEKQSTSTSCNFLFQFEQVYYVTCYYFFCSDTSFHFSSKDETKIFIDELGMMYLYVDRYNIVDAYRVYTVPQDHSKNVKIIFFFYLNL